VVLIRGETMDKGREREREIIRKFGEEGVEDGE
jgi:Holliday junction resolvase